MTLYIATYLDSLSPLPSLLWRLGLAWFGLQCQCWFAEIFPENDHSLVLLLTFANFISLTYQNDCKTILIKEFMLGVVKTNQLSLSASRLSTLTWGIPENVHSYSCRVLLFQSLTWSQYDCKTILFEELMLGMKKKSIYLYLLLLWLAWGIISRGFKLVFASHDKKCHFNIKMAFACYLFFLSLCHSYDSSK